ncbi:MAG: lyase family protein [Patescibacteria group bacterium]|nr:hypothetical protein [Patescibacteria group bacterium]MBU1876795.1 hypothetical protein [Patescibacteria group bacterium]
MVPFFGYDNLYRKLAEVEIATLQVLGELNIIPSEEMAKLTPELIKKIMEIPTTEVDRIEKEITKHDVRAWVRKAQQIINGELGRWVHIPLTSYDALDTGRMLQFRDAYYYALRQSLYEVVLALANLVEKYADQIQIGRTHGQHALPITVGFWLATILHRIIYNWQQMDICTRAFVGKISGAVGAHNAQVGLNFTDPNKRESFEVLVLKKLNLKPAKISTQILPPEPLAYFLFSSAMLSATLGQFGRDGRNLMKTEIAEVAEAFEENQVGSSTMAHKRNPINFEGLEGGWIRTKNELGKLLDNLISEHQRDLVGSSPIRDYPIIVINLQKQLDTLLKKKNNVSFLERITINRDNCQINFEKSSSFILAEPLYIALQMAGYNKDAHEFVNRQLVPMAKEKNICLIEALEELCTEDVDLRTVKNKIPTEVLKLLHHPEQYTGDAREKALEIASYARQMAQKLMKKRD